MLDVADAVVVLRNPLNGIALVDVLDTDNPFPLKPPRLFSSNPSTLCVENIVPAVYLVPLLAELELHI
jgi:hypothetical protein